VSQAHQERVGTELKVLLIHNRTSHVLAPANITGEACGLTLELEADAASHIEGFHGDGNGVFVLKNSGELPPLLERSAWILEHVTNRPGIVDFLPTQWVFWTSNEARVQARTLVGNTNDALTRATNATERLADDFETLARNTEDALARAETEVKKVAAVADSTKDFLDFIKYPIALAFVVWAACQIVALWR
jgi:hypothetical protein